MHIALRSIIFLAIVGIGLFFVANFAFAYEQIAPQESITIGEFVYDDNFVATTTPCTISIYDPSGVLIVDQAMTANSNGWHYYEFAGTSTLGIWPTTMQCGATSTSDLIKMDKTFTIGYSSVATSTLVESIWNYTDRTLTSGASIAADIWSDVSAPIRRLTDKVFSGGGSIATEDYINTATTTLLGGINQVQASYDAQWNITMSNVDRVLVGKTYRAKISIVRASSTPSDSFSAPLLTLYDANRNVIASSVAMTWLSTGTYEYTYIIPGSAAEGLWEATVATEVESGKTLNTNDYWTVEGSPAQVIIYGVTDTTVPDIIANVTITNEGSVGYEYHYEWCVVSESTNACGGGDDVFYGSASKYINSGTDWNTNLSATVSTIGSYYFKLVVYYGAEQSGASRTFTTQAAVVTPPSEGGGVGGGGGGGGFIIQPTPISTSTTILNAGTCKGADFNFDSKVNSIDFFILLAFWKTSPPFRNPCVDINGDQRVNSVDFSILMFQWGKKVV